MSKCTVSIRVDPDFFEFLEETKRREKLTTPQLTRKLSEKQILIYNILVDENIEKQFWEKLREEQKRINF